MRRNIILITVLFITVFFSCKSVPTNEVRDGNVLELIDEGRYRFRAETALPSGYKSIDLSYGYSLDITKDSIISFLPFFGRAYTAPMSHNESGIKFTSTNFEYWNKEGKNNREITLKTKDLHRNITMYLNIQNSGRATLTVNDPYRRQISFYGIIERY